MIEQSTLYTDEEATREALAAAEAAERDSLLTHEFLNELIQIQDEADTADFLQGKRLTGTVVHSPHHPSFDPKPEHTSYVDTGCDLHGSCLTCPLPRCRYDDGGSINSERIDRDELIATLRRESQPIEAIASSVGVSSRTVHRVLAKVGS